MRNIINSKEVYIFLEEIIAHNQLNKYENIKKWIMGNLKNYLVKKHDYNNVSFTQLTKEQEKNVIEYKIKEPYHIVDLSIELREKINHIIDFFKSERGDKDLNRVGFEAALDLSEKWLNKLNDSLSEEEDYLNIVPVIEVKKKNGEKNTWFNLRSKKALEREGKLMDNCISTYWKDYKKSKNIDKDYIDIETPFYSLRDENNKPILTLNMIVDNNIYTVKELKERFNQISFDGVVNFLPFFNYIKNKEDTKEIIINDNSIEYFFKSKLITKDNNDKNLLDYLKSKENIMFEKFIDQKIFLEILNKNDFLNTSNKIKAFFLNMNNDNCIEHEKIEAKSFYISELSGKKISIKSNEISISNSNETSFSIELADVNSDNSIRKLSHVKKRLLKLKNLKDINIEIVCNSNCDGKLSLILEDSENVNILNINNIRTIIKANNVKNCKFENKLIEMDEQKEISKYEIINYSDIANDFDDYKSEEQMYLIQKLAHVFLWSQKNEEIDISLKLLDLNKIYYADLDYINEIVYDTTNKYKLFGINYLENIKNIGFFTKNNQTEKGKVIIQNLLDVENEKIKDYWIKKEELIMSKAKNGEKILGLWFDIEKEITVSALDINKFLKIIFNLSLGDEDYNKKFKKIFVKKDNTLRNSLLKDLNDLFLPNLLNKKIHGINGYSVRNFEKCKKDINNLIIENFENFYPKKEILKKIKP